MQDEGQSYYRRVLEELPGEGCPACREVDAGIDEYLRRTLYGRITDRRFRAAFDAADGFCRRHAHRLAAFSDGLAISLLYENPLKWSLEERTFADRLKDLMEKIKPGKRTFRGFEVTGECPACDRETEFLRHYLSIIKRYWDREELKDAFCRSGGLCLPHYRRLIARSKPPIWLKTFQQQKVDRLSQAIQRFVDYSNATGGARPQLSREEQLIWKEVLQFLYGDRVLPETEVPPDRDSW